MDVTHELRCAVDRMSDDPLPVTWRGEPALRDVASFGALVTRIRRLDVRSDSALRALARLALSGEREACFVVTAALLPLLIARCERRPALVAEAIGELASRMVEPAEGFLESGVANRLLRRVVWRVRHDHGARGWQFPVPDPAEVLRRNGAGTHECFEGRLVDRLALEEFRRRLAQRPQGHEVWTALVDSSQRSGLSSSQRSRLLRHRPSVRPLAVRTLVA